MSTRHRLSCLLIFMMLASMPSCAPEDGKVPTVKKSPEDNTDLIARLNAAAEGKENLGEIIEKFQKQKKLSDDEISAIERKFQQLLKQDRKDWGNQRIFGWGLAILLQKANKQRSLPILKMGLKHPDDRYRYYSAKAIEDITGGFISIKAENEILENEAVDQIIRKLDKWGEYSEEEKRKLINEPKEPEVPEKAEPTRNSEGNNIKTEKEGRKEFPIRYQAKDGDTLANIIRRYYEGNVQANSIMSLIVRQNHLDPSKPLKEGTILILPSPKTENGVVVQVLQHGQNDTKTLNFR